MEGIVNVWLAKMRTTRRIGIMVAGWVLVVQPLFMLPAHASTIQSGSVVVNELSTQPGWVELYNTTGTPVEMTNWQLQTKEQAQNLSGTLTAYGFLVFDAT